MFIHVIKMYTTENIRYITNYVCSGNLQTQPTLQPGDISGEPANLQELQLLRGDKIIWVEKIHQTSVEFSLVYTTSEDEV